MNTSEEVLVLIFLLHNAFLVVSSFKKKVKRGKYFLTCAVFKRPFSSSWNPAKPFTLSSYHSQRDVLSILTLVCWQFVRKVSSWETDGCIWNGWMKTKPHPILGLSLGACKAESTSQIDSMTSELPQGHVFSYISSAHMLCRKPHLLRYRPLKQGVDMNPCLPRHRGARGRGHG